MDPATWLTIGISLLAGIITFAIAKSAGLSDGKAALLALGAAGGTGALAYGALNGERDENGNLVGLDDIVKNAGVITNPISGAVENLGKQKLIDHGISGAENAFKEHPYLIAGAAAFVCYLLFKDK